MKVLNIKMNNILNFQNLELDFETNRRYSEKNYDKIYKIDDHKILSKIGIIGKNASGKTTIVNFFSMIVDVLSNKFLHDLMVEFSKKLRDKVEESKYNNMFSIDSSKNQFFNQFAISEENNNLKDDFNPTELDEEFYKNIVKKLLSKIVYSYDDGISFTMDYLENDKRKQMYIDISINSLTYKISIDDEVKIVSIIEIFHEMHNFFLENIYKTNALISGSFVNLMMAHYSRNIYPNKFINDEFNNKKIKFINLFKILIANSYQNNEASELSFRNFFIVYSKINDNEKDKDEFVKKFIQWINISDESITDIKLDTKNKVISGFMNKRNKLLTFDELSLGTRKWIFLFPFLVDNNPSLLVIDEIENSLHQKLSLALLDFFPECNKQIIFTTHNPYLFEKGTRPDSVYYIDKDIEDNSVLVRLSDEINIEKKHVISEFFKKELIGNHPVPKPFKKICFGNINEK